MGRRIIDLQRQLRELGRIRTGHTEQVIKDGQPQFRDGQPVMRPVRSKTFILTSPQVAYLNVAAETYGGTVERWKPQGAGADEWRLITTSDTLAAVLPPGDPLDQINELWSRGGCMRRCDGETDEVSRKPCLCRAEFGDKWYEQGPLKVCRPHTRLNLFLDLPDAGYWRFETKSFYGAMELGGTVDLIKAAIRARTGGADLGVGIRLRIDPRERIAGGKTKHFPVVVIELLGSTAVQILSGVVPVVGQLESIPERAAISAPQPDRPAIESPPAVKTVRPAMPSETPGGRPIEDVALPASDAVDRDMWSKRIADAPDVEQLREVWNDLRAANVVDEGLKKEWWARKQAIDAASRQPANVVDAEPDRTQVWAEILRIGFQKHQWTTSQASATFREQTGKDPSAADGFALQLFLDALKEGQVS